ncbi:MAG: electron transport complex subunit RsxA [Xanthomonadales bacterium]|jgi:electron transport complex protein RnfA|nr:electron transport complex subunit RsxA [Xanthomonadales bacterium]
MLEQGLLILVSTVLANNFVLTRFLGLCPFMGVSNKIEGAMGMALATMFVLTLASVSSYLVYQYVLLPLNITYLATVSFILIIAALVQAIELIIRSQSPLLHRVLGIYLPLITTNCAVLGVALLNVRQQHHLFEAALFGFGAGLGFGIVLVSFAALRERIERSPVPEPFKGAPIALITAGIMAMAFMGFTGMVKA